MINSKTHKSLSYSKEDLMAKLPAYELTIEEKIEELESTGLVFRHKKTGARILVLSNEDDNKVFSIGFRTPPSDSTGVAHILEHSVLCGSKGFPAKDPFVELVKGSLNTFLNAMTYPDKTLYPIASCNDKDFQNLMHVYMDAVFYPNIYEKEEIFKQEGWHYELEEEEGELSYNGVVYNEMKGAFSSPEQQLFRLIQQSLFPDTTYGKESGGDPEYITDLTYDDFLAFHKKYYHPSNSYIYLYGDMDVVEKLNWMDENYLSVFTHATVDSRIALQEPFPKMKEAHANYSLGQNEALTDKTYLSYSTVIDTSLNRELYLAFQVLETALVSAPGAPLKQAILDAGIGKDVLSSFDNSIYQPIFSIIAKNSEESKKEEFLLVIRKVLEGIVKDGVDQRALQAAINYYEFKYREADFGSFPKGLMYGLQIMESWLYDDMKPFIHIRANDTFEFLRSKIGTGYYTDLIQKYLLDNTHTSLVMIKPVTGLTNQIEEEVKQRLATYKESLSNEQIKKLIEDTKALTAYQETPSSKEELEKIPMLTRDDIGKKPQPLYLEHKQIKDVPVLHHNLYTNGIHYINFLFDLEKVPKEYTPYLSLLATVMGYIDTDHYSFLEFANEVNIYTGGITTDVSMYGYNAKPEQITTKLEIRTKVLAKNTRKALELIEEMLYHTKLDDAKRLREIILELKSKIQMRMNSQGHSVAVSRVMSYYAKGGVFNELTSGISYYRFLDYLEKNFETEKESLISHLKSLMKHVFTRSALLISITANDEGYKTSKDSLENFIMNLPSTQSSYHIGVKPAGFALKDIAGDVLKDGEWVPTRFNEGFMTSAKVQYVARGGNFILDGLEYNGALKVLKTILSYEYLWTNIRIKGGAYGCMSGFSWDGNGYLVSYRDPNLAQTNDIYNKTPEFIKNFTVDERDMTKYVIGTISGLDTPLNPLAKGNRSLAAYLSGLTYEDMQKERDTILSVSIEDIRALSDIMQAVLDQAYICVIGNEKKIEENKELFDNILSLTE